MLLGPVRAGRWGGRISDIWMRIRRELQGAYFKLVGAAAERMLKICHHHSICLKSE